MCPRGQGRPRGLHLWLKPSRNLFDVIRRCDGITILLKQFTILQPKGVEIELPTMS